MPIPRHQPDLDGIDLHMVALFDKHVSGSPQKPSSGTAVIPDVADTDMWNDTVMWNNTLLCEHECCVPLIKLLQQPTCKCSSLADVVRL